MSIHTIAQAIMDICNFFEPSFDVEGGEFFLREDIDSFFKLVPSRFWPFITVTTNGVARIPVDVSVLRELGDLRVSVEGHTDALQQEIRGIPLRPVLETCYRLQAGGVPLTLRITLHRKNYHALTEMLLYLMDLGFTKFSLFEFQAVGRGRDHEAEFGLNSEEIEMMLAQISSFPIDSRLDTLKLSLNMSRVPIVARYRANLVVQGFEIIDLTNTPSLTINYNGDLGVCPWNVGQERIGTIQGIDLVPALRGYIAAGQLDHACDHCSAIRILYKKRGC